MRSRTAFSWIDAPWTVAAVLGIWGALIGIEAYVLANCAASLAGILAAVRFGRDTLIWTRRRRTSPFVLGLLGLATLLGFDFWFTSHQKAASEEKSHQLAQLGQIPELKNTIAAMTENERMTATAQAVEQAKLEQRMMDIGDDNKRLKSSIEKKDAVLASIAEKEYSLNFEPRLTVTTNEERDRVTIQNGGKSNIEVELPLCLGQYRLIPSGEQPTLIAPTSSATYRMSDIGNALILAEAKSHPDGRAHYECETAVTTADRKKYKLPFTWTFIATDGKITRSFAMPHPIEDVR